MNRATAVIAVLVLFGTACNPRSAPATATPPPTPPASGEKPPAPGSALSPGRNVNSADPRAADLDRALRHRYRD